MKLKKSNVRIVKNTKHIKFRIAREQKRVYKDLTIPEAGFLFKIMPYIQWETNRLVGDGEIGKKDKPLKWADIDKILGCSKRHRIDTVRSLIDKKFIIKIHSTENGPEIYVNPKFFIRGYKADEYLRKLFDPDEQIIDTYSEYLESSHWQERRKLALERASFKCQLCSKKEKLHVHHNTYENLGNEKDEDLIVLCSSCHEKFHSINGR